MRGMIKYQVSALTRRQTAWASTTASAICPTLFLRSEDRNSPRNSLGVSSTALPLYWLHIVRSRFIFSLYDAQKSPCLLQLRKQFFFRLKLARVHAPPAPVQLYRVFQVQHLVVENVFDRIARHARMIEDAADHDSVVRWVIVSEAAAGVIPAPGKLRTSHESVKKAAVKVVDDFFQMIMMSAGGADVLASAHLADESRFGGNVVPRDIAPITHVVSAIDRLAIEL